MEDALVPLHNSNPELSEALDDNETTARLEVSDPVLSLRECLVRMLERIDKEKPQDPVEEVGGVCELGMVVESRFVELEETRRREKKELENSVVSLTEENRDLNSLLRAALSEKAVVERRLRGGGGGDQSRTAAILQIAERGLQRVGFGFMVGTAAVGETVDGDGLGSDGGEPEEEVVTVASTLEKIMKNLRFEINQLRFSLDEARSDSERLQRLSEKQAQQITENALYIVDLEERESLLTQHVEDLMSEIREAEEEVVRWREACEMEVEAGKSVIEERERETELLKQELEMTKVELVAANGKLKLKEELAAAAMAAQEAIAKSLQLADSRSVCLRERIEELTRQLEEADCGNNNRNERSVRRRVRHVCWPWPTLKISPTASRGSRRSVPRRSLPEMEALLRDTSIHSGVTSAVFGKRQAFSQGRTSAAESSAFGRSQPSQLRSQSQQSFSQGMSMSQLSQNSLEDILTNEQGLSSQDRGNLATKVSCLAPVANAQESQLQLSRTSNNVIRKWNPNSVADNRCHVSEELERRIGLMETSVNRLGIILDSVQSDVIQINKSVKEISMEMQGIQQKMIVNDNSMQMMIKGDEEIKANLDESLKAIPNQLRKSSDHQRLQDISSAISTMPDQIEARLLRFQGELCNMFTKEVQVMANSIKHTRVNQPTSTIQPPEMVEDMLFKESSMEVGEEKKFQIIIDSDEEFDGAFSCLLDEKKPEEFDILALKT
ncbi:Uncharacterized protein QJS10_CPB21g00427 [Acorus calamus]|uniref:Uncharacterized protein n=1 Tax=Acorus calamus TaxID=4465 RepID=A0AAV9C4X5_ACOCL|nr:Uncharacterized protein QJS10_CPB21g00427 [Acorus calamus]